MSVPPELLLKAYIKHYKTTGEDLYVHPFEEVLEDLRRCGIGENAISTEELRSVWDYVNVAVPVDGIKDLVPTIDKETGKSTGYLKAVNAAQDAVLQAYGDNNSRMTLAVDNLLEEVGGVEIKPVHAPIYEWNPQYSMELEKSVKNILHPDYIKGFANGGRRDGEKWLGVKNPQTYKTFTKGWEEQGIDARHGDFIGDQPTDKGHDLAADLGGRTSDENTSMQAAGANRAVKSLTGTEAAKKLVGTDTWNKNEEIILNSEEISPERTLTDKRSNRVRARVQAKHLAGKRIEAAKALETLCESIAEELFDV